MPSIRKAILLIEKHHPSTPTEFKKIGLHLKFVGAGAFREVCRIKDCDLVVKFPLNEAKGKKDYRAGKLHSTNEVKRIKALSAYSELRPHLPKVHYHNRKTGVLVMQYYESFDKDTFQQFVKLGNVVIKLVKRLTGVTMSDVHWGNFHKEKNKGVFIDLGY